MRPEAENFLATLPVSEVYPCSYLLGLEAQQQHFYWPAAHGPMPGALYQDLMDRHFRRSGRLFYRPMCAGCQRCIPLRMRVADFVLSRSQARVVKKNRDLVVAFGPPELDDARFALYSRYCLARHEREAPVREDFEQFLYDSPTETVEASYWADGELVGVGLCDVTPRALSTVYFYFDPEQAARSLGVYSVLREIEYAKALRLEFYYLGYWVPGSKKMEYKAGFGAHEILVQGNWKKVDRAG